MGGQNLTLQPRHAPKTILKGTKAEVLAELANAGFCVPETFFFTVGKWRSSPDEVSNEIVRRLPPSTPLAVRSSCHREDREDSSMAGAFLSHLSVPCPPDAGFARAVEEVIVSYGEAADDADQILVQPMVRDVVMSGVVMTRDLEDGSPYYVVDYDDESGRTDSITGGSGTVSKTVHVFRQFRNSDFDSTRLLQVVRTARQIEGYLGSNRLDIEFCLDGEDTLHILQARTIGGSTRWTLELDEEIVDKISFVEETLSAWNRPQEGIWGERTILGVMPDWNPAEIIGIHPRPLAATLYRDLVTKRTWSLARQSMGYRELPPTELMLLLAGRPYIDVRASFNSFLPEGVSKKTGTALVEAWIERLGSRPEFHDKVEFEVAQTVADPLLAETYRSRTPGALDAAGYAEWTELLRTMTLRCLRIDPEGSLHRAVQSARTLEANQSHRGTSLPERPSELLARAEALLEECRNLGTLPFSVIARHAFIAESFLRAAVAKEALGREDVDRFRTGIRTISGEFGDTVRAVRAGTVSPAAFLERFGHLRPGTYDILSPRYADHPDSVLSGSAPESHENPAPFEADLQAFDRLLAETLPGGPGARQLLEYATQAIAGREWAKFVFTRNLSEAIECIARWGERSGLSREELSWLSIEDILDSKVAPPLCAPREWYRPLVEQGRRTARIGQGLKLGYLIRSPRDVYVMPRHRSAPNYVTRKKIRAPVVHLDGRDFEIEGLQGAIVCIRNADPGFDWLFSRGIGGLVTQFGGTNSHMAIRCTEYGIPAAIGCGEQLFESVRRARACELDAAGKSLRPLENT